MKKIAVIFTLLLVFAGIPAAVLLTQQKSTEMRSKAAPSTTLTFSPSSASKAIGESFTVDATIETGGNQIVSADLIITYDPNVLDVSDIAVGTFLPGAQVIQKNINSSSGTIAFSIYTTKANAATGNGSLAKITMMGKNSGTSSLLYDASKTSLYGLAENQNVWTKNQAPASIAITESTSDDATVTIPPTEPPADLPEEPPPDEESDASGGDQYSDSESGDQYTEESAPDEPEPDFVLLNPKKGAVVKTTLPTIKGKAKPNSTITYTIYSNPVTGVITVDANGNFEFTPDSPLADASHNITLTEEAADGTSRTLASDFIVQAAPIPATGAVETTAVLLGIGTLLLFLGLRLAPVL